MASATDHHVELPAEAVVNECVEAVEEEGSMIPYLPCVIMTDILLRLPAECIFQLWQRNDLLCHLTTTPYFKRAHLDRSTPDIVVQSLNEEEYDSNIKLFIFNGKAENVATSLAISSFNKYLSEPIDLWSSYEGFLIFKTRDSPASFLCILNPVTKEQVILTSPNNLCYVCGFYFHPRKKEYEVICVRGSDDVDEGIWEFEILSLRTQNRRSVGSCRYPPSRRRWPVLVNGTFYWMACRSDSILSFDIETEQISTMETVSRYKKLNSWAKIYVENLFQLFELEGSLSLFDRSKVVIWVFDHTTKRWDNKHSLPSPVDDKKHDWEFARYFTDIKYNQRKGEFVAYNCLKREKPLYIYNLRLGTWKMLEKKGFEDDRCEATIYTPSLFSLDAADSVISL